MPGMGKPLPGAVANDFISTLRRFPLLSTLAFFRQHYEIVSPLNLFRLSMKCINWVRWVLHGKMSWLCSQLSDFHSSRIEIVWLLMSPLLVLSHNARAERKRNANFGHGMLTACCNNQFGMRFVSSPYPFENGKSTVTFNFGIPVGFRILEFITRRDLASFMG